MREINDIVRDVKMARAYVKVTQEHGPSQQLIDFINHDGRLGDEIGLEGFSNFSTTTQHELLLSRLQTDLYEALAMEGLGSFFKKLAHKFSSKPKGEDFKKYADAELDLRDETRSVYPYGVYEKCLRLGRESFKIVNEGLGKSFDEKNEPYFKELLKRCEAVEDKFDQFVVMTPMNKAGWDEGKLKSAIREFVAFEKEFDAISEKVRSHYSKYEHMEESEIPKSALSLAYSYNLTLSACNDIYRALNSVAGCFKIVG